MKYLPLYLAMAGLFLGTGCATIKKNVTIVPDLSYARTLKNVAFDNNQNNVSDLEEIVAYVRKNGSIVEFNYTDDKGEALGNSERAGYFIDIAADDPRIESLKEAFPDMKTLSIAVGELSSLTPLEDILNHPRLTFGITTTSGKRYIVSDAKYDGFQSVGDQVMIQIPGEDNQVYDLSNMSEQEKLSSQNLFNGLVSLAVKVLEL